MKLNHFFRIIIFSLICFTIYLLITTFIFDYNLWTDSHIKWLNFEKQTTRIKKIFTQEVFIFFRSFMFFFLFLGVFLFYFSNKISIFIHFYIRDFLSSIKKVFFYFKNEKIFFLILCIPVISTIYFGYSSPISYDEAWTYLQFSKNGFLVSLSYYPAPNNHVLHSLITNFFNLFLSDYPKVVLRLPVVMISTLALFVSFYSISKHYHKSSALFVTALYPMLSMSIYYGYQSRGYALVVLFFILCFHFVLNINQNNKSRDWFWFTLFSILGFFTMPSFLYIYIILNVIILLQYSKEKIINQVKYGLITVFFTLLLYSPIILFNGFEALSSNRFVTPISRIFVMKCLPDFFKLTIENIFGIHFIVPFLVITFSGLLFLKQKEKTYIAWYIAFFSLPIILLIGHAVLPFYRTFNYYSFIIILMFALSITQFLSKISHLKLLILLFLIQTLMFLNYFDYVKKIDDFAEKSKTIALEIKADSKKYLVYSGLFETYLFYYLKTEKHQHFEITHQPFINISSDTINENSYIIIDAEFDKTTIQKPLFKNEYYNVYQKFETK